MATNDQVAELLAGRTRTLTELFRRRRFEPLCTKDGKLHTKQLEALQILTDDETREFGYGGAAGGAKSWTGCEWLIFSSLAYPGIRSFIGREELKRLRESTLITFFKVCREYGVGGWKYNGQDHYIQFDNGSRVDLLDLKYLPSDPLYERYGSIEYTLGWIEEGGEVNEGAYDTLKSRIGRQLNDKYKLLPKLFVTLNPKKNWCHRVFWKPFKEKTLPNWKKFLQAFVQDNPFIPSSYIDQLNSITDKVRRERLLLGNFDYDDDDAALMPYDKIQDVWTNFHVPGGRKCITSDMARFGGDKIVKIDWDGFRGHITWWDRTATNVSGEKLETARGKMGIGKSDVLVDDDGLGGGVVDFMGFKGFVNNASPMPTPESPQVDFNGKPVRENYENLKAQCSFRMADRVNKNEVYLTFDDDRVREWASEEMEQVKQKEVDTDKKRGVLSKSEIKALLGRSPDFWDAIMMREWFELAPVYEVAVG